MRPLCVNLTHSCVKLTLLTLPEGVGHNYLHFTPCLLFCTKQVETSPLQFLPQQPFGQLLESGPSW